MDNGIKILLTRFYAVCFMCLYSVMVYESFPGLARLFGLRPESGIYPAACAFWFMAAVSACFWVVEPMSSRLIARFYQEHLEDDE
ncbi:MAG TPA: hypothetical protein PL039_06085 [Kiritimatiellia bacterium]|nr:hypothetical protein [Kiritimatiellia bacterium]